MASVVSKPEEMRERTKQFAYRIVRLFRALPATADAQVPGKQLLRCGTSVAANYRAVCRARSKAEFISKMGVVVEEADETVFWLELLVDTGILNGNRTQESISKAKEITAIFTASHRTAKK